MKGSADARALAVARSMPQDSVYRGGPIKLPPPWAGYSFEWAEALARSESVPLALRVMFAAMSRVEPRSGHARFAPRELGAILADSDGEPRPTNGVGKALRQAKSLGYVLPDSDARLVKLDRASIQRGDGTPSFKLKDWDDGVLPEGVPF